MNILIINTSWLAKNILSKYCCEQQNKKEELCLANQFAKCVNIVSLVNFLLATKRRSVLKTLPNFCGLCACLEKERNLWKIPMNGFLSVKRYRKIDWVWGDKWFRDVEWMNWWEVRRSKTHGIFCEEKMFINIFLLEDPISLFFKEDFINLRFIADPFPLSFAQK